MRPVCYNFFHHGVQAQKGESMIGSIDLLDSLGDRMKRYEKATRTVVTPRTPIIIRVDGKAFHTYTRPLNNNDVNFSDGMIAVAVALCADIQGAQFAYTQSDEVSVLIHPYKRFVSSAWFDGQVQKMCSVSASIASGVMTAMSREIFDELRIAAFDSRVFVLPEEEVCNYFVWRQKDCVRNSIQAWARSVLGPSKCHGMPQTELLLMCNEAHRPWDENLQRRWKYGIDVQRDRDRDDLVDVNTFLENRCGWDVYEAPLFEKNRHHIERHLEKEQE